MTGSFVAGAPTVVSAAAQAGPAPKPGVHRRERPRFPLYTTAAAALLLAVVTAGIAEAEPVSLAMTGMQARAQVQGTVLAQGQVLAQAESVNAVLDNIRNWIMGIAAGLATVFITIGAVRYMAAGGDLGEVEKAKTAFRSAAFGYALALLTPLVLSVLREIVGAG